MQQKRSQSISELLDSFLLIVSMALRITLKAKLVTEAQIIGERTDEVLKAIPQSHIQDSHLARLAVSVNHR